MTISTSAMVCICIAMALGLLVPIALLIFVPKKTGGSRKAFWIGCLIMFLFALTLESLLNSFVYKTEVGKTIWNNVFLYALYGGLMAGLFEETGRFLAFRTVLKKDLENDNNALTYAVGHGGFEMFAILFFSMLNNLTYALVMNHPEKVEQIYEHATAAEAEQIRQVYEQLSATPAWTYLLSVAERGSALLLQLGLSILVWFAAKKGGKKVWLYPAAIALHMLVDGGMVLFHKFTGSVIATELFIFIMATGVVFLAWNVWEKEKKR